MPARTKLFVRNFRDFGDIYAIMCARDDGQGHRKVLCRPEEVDYIEANTTDAYDPLLRLSTEEAQQLMDELWAAGLRPTEGKGLAGAMAAVQEHLRSKQLEVSYLHGLLDRHLTIVEQQISHPLIVSELRSTGDSNVPSKENSHKEKH